MAKVKFKEDTRVSIVVNPKIGTGLVGAGDSYVAAIASKGTTLSEFLRGMADLIDADVVCNDHKLNDSSDERNNTHKCGVF